MSFWVDLINFPKISKVFLLIFARTKLIKESLVRSLQFLDGLTDNITFWGYSDVGKNQGLKIRIQH